MEPEENDGMSMLTGWWHHEKAQSHKPFTNDYGVLGKEADRRKYVHRSVSCFLVFINFNIFYTFDNVYSSIFMATLGRQNPIMWCRPETDNLLIRPAVRVVSKRRCLTRWLIKTVFVASKRQMPQRHLDQNAIVSPKSDALPLPVRREKWTRDTCPRTGQAEAASPTSTTRDP